MRDSKRYTIVLAHKTFGPGGRAIWYDVMSHRHRR